MGADQVTYEARFKDGQKRYDLIRDELINGFCKIGLIPDESPLDWEKLFEVKDDYLELYIYNCFGNWGNAMDYIEKTFIKEHGDVMVEFAVIEYYDGVCAEGIIYDGKKVIHELPPFVEAELINECFDDYETEEDDFLEDEDEGDLWYKFEFDSIDSITINGNIFVLTGLGFDDYKKITDIILREGGEIKSSTVLKTNYLIVDEEQFEPSTKYNRAIELKGRGKPISIISVRQFYELYENRQ